MRWTTDRKLTKKMTAGEAEQSLIRLGCIPTGEIADNGEHYYRVPGDTEDEQAAWYEQKIRQYGLYLE